MKNKIKKSKGAVEKRAINNYLVGLKQKWIRTFSCPRKYFLFIITMVFAFSMFFLDRFASYYTGLINPTIPIDYVAMTTLYTVLYIGAALLIALVLFERREVRE